MRFNHSDIQTILSELICKSTDIENMFHRFYIHITASLLKLTFTPIYPTWLVLTHRKELQFLLYVFNERHALKHNAYNEIYLGNS